MRRLVGVVSNMPGTEGFTMVCFNAADVPVGTKIYVVEEKQPLKAIDVLIEELKK